MSLISGNESIIFARGVIGNVRKAQEDNHGLKLATPNGDLFVVCDGMGGHVGGAMASKIAVDSIIGYIDSEQYSSPIDAMNGALQFANMQILGYADAHPEYKGMGTTACIVLLRGDDVWIAHVGDSRIYLYLGKEGRLHRITKDHSFVQTLVDAGQITDEDAEHHPNKNRIMKALGIKPEMQPTFNYGNMSIHPKNGDVFLICSDGLCGMIPDRTIESVLNEKKTLHDKGERLIELAMIGETVQPGGQDNCTLELVEIDNSPWENSEFKSFNPIKPNPPAAKVFDLPGTQKSDAALSSSSMSRPSMPKPVVPHDTPQKNKKLRRLVIIAVTVLIVTAAILLLGKSSFVLEMRVKRAYTQLQEAKKEAGHAEREWKYASSVPESDQTAADSRYGVAQNNLQKAEKKYNNLKNKLNACKKSGIKDKKHKGKKK